MRLELSAKQARLLSRQLRLGADRHLTRRRRLLVELSPGVAVDTAQPGAPRERRR